MMHAAPNRAPLLLLLLHLLLLYLLLLHLLLLHLLLLHLLLLHMLHLLLRGQREKMTNATHQISLEGEKGSH